MIQSKEQQKCGFNELDQYDSRQKFTVIFRHMRKKM
jgi:hypothetical protein